MSIALQNVATTLTETDERIINGSYCSVTLSTVNSRYTLVKRSCVAVLINDSTGVVRTGVDAYIDTDGCLTLVYGGRSGGWVTTPVVSAYVMEN